MKEDLLNLIATYGALADAFTWFMAFAACLIYGFAGWAFIAAGRLVAVRIHASFARANQTIADIQQPRKETL
jgi:hypothetical protein